MKPAGLFLKAMRRDRDQENDNIVNIDGSRFTGTGRNRYSKGLLSRITPEHIGAAVFLLVFIYLCINLYIYATKEQVSIYEVQAQNLSYDRSYPAVCIRDEQLVSSGYSGYVNYYIQNGRKCAKSSVVYSVDASGSNVYTALNASLEDISLSSDEIRKIKSDISGAMKSYNGADLTWTEGFKTSLVETLYDYVSRNTLAEMDRLSASGNSSSDFHSVRSDRSGVISYTADSLCGLDAAGIDADLIKNNTIQPYSLRKTGLVSSGEPVYRICDNEEWSIVALVTEDFYINNLETRDVTVYINGGLTPVKGQLKLLRKDSDYLAQIILDEYMSSYMDTRFVSIEFDYEDEAGLKIPRTAITQKGYYIVPLTVFSAEEGAGGYVLKRETYDAATGAVAYEDIYPKKYYSDGYYAYLDTTLVNEGDIICNPDTGERVKIATVNYLDGVYCVNKGYYVFTRIEKLRSNDEYTIVKKGTKDGLRLYDHIALNAADAVEGKIIY